MATTVIEPSTQQPVDLTGLSPEERLYCAFLEHCDPDTFCGYDSAHCLCGQIAEPVLGTNDYTVDDIADHFGVQYYLLLTLFRRAGRRGRDLGAALLMAREVLGLDEHGRNRS